MANTLTKSTKKATAADAKAINSAVKSTTSGTAKKTTTASKYTPGTEYTTNSLAKNAMSILSAIPNGLRVNDLTSYSSKNSALGKQLRSDFITDEKLIRNRMDAATRAAYDANRAAAIQDAMNAEDVNYANTRNAITELRRNLIGSGSSGANVGAANATALQALLGIGQSNAQTTTDSLRAINDVSRQRAAALASNAVEAINTANDATSKMYDPATSSYGADHTYGMQGATEAVGTLASAIDTAASGERQASDTNRANVEMNRYTADQSLAGEKYTADSNLAGTKHTANQNLAGEKYVADKNLAGTQHTANQNLAGEKYVADKNLEGTKHTANQNLTGEKYVADQNLAGTKYNANKNLEIEKTTKKTDNTNRSK